MAKIQEQRPRAAVYIDGFNLYYPVRDMNENHLKWCNFKSLSGLLCEENGHDLVKVVFCTAIQKHNSEAAARHKLLNAAQLAVGTEILEGHYVWDDDRDKHTEKQSDINVALSLVLDGIDDVYDWAYLVSADSDQAATARFFRERLPEKSLAIVAPPNRTPPSKAKPYADLSFTILKSQIENSLFPQYVPNGERFVVRPMAYDPPAHWLPPKDRPKRVR